MKIPRKIISIQKAIIKNQLKTFQISKPKRKVEQEQKEHTVAQMIKDCKKGILTQKGNRIIIVTEKNIDK